MEDVEAGEGRREGGPEEGGGGQFLSVEEEVSRGRMVGREGGKEGGMDLMEEYARRLQRAVEVKAARAATRRVIMTSATATAAATAEGDKDPEAVAQLLHAAARTLLHRALTSLCIYYLPYFLHLIILLTLHYGPPPPGVAFFFFLFYTVGSPVMQAAVLVGVAVGIGRNIRRYGRREVEEEEMEEEEMVRAAAASVVVGGVEEKTEGSRPGQGEEGREGGVVGGGHGREEWKEGVCRSRCGRYQLFMRSPSRRRQARR